MNQFMTPGLGSLGVGRKVAGRIQLTLAIGGFVLVVVWMGNMLRATLEGALPGEALAVLPWQWKTGLGLLAGGWTCALVTSLQVLWETRHERGPGPPPLPPSGPTTT